MRDDYSTVRRGFHVASGYETAPQLAGNCHLGCEEEDPQKILLLAREMIRALDAKSTKHMENVSAAEKICGEKAA